MNFYLPVFLTGFIVVALVGLNRWSYHRSRPVGKVKDFNTRYVPTVWDEKQLNEGILSFWNAWLKHYPETDEKKLRRILNSIDLLWTSRRWKHGETFIAAEAISRKELKLWRGPRIQGYKYKMSYTALAEGLIQIVVYNLDGRVLDSKTISEEFKPVIKDAKRDLDKQIGYENEKPGT